MSEYSEKQLKEVWEKAKIVDEKYKDEFRQDFAGAWIQWSKYGDHTSSYGWDVDHEIPISRNGSNNINNLQPLQWQNNLKKGDNYPCFYTEVTSDGNKNIDMIRNWKY